MKMDFIWNEMDCNKTWKEKNGFYNIQKILSFLLTKVIKIIDVY